MGAVRTLEDLKNTGFNVEEGIRLCGGDEETYMEVIWAAMMEGREKIPLIRKVYGEGDLERYQIEVHGLKNAMKSIGANYLSQLAGEQEQAARTENYAVMKVGVEELLEQYQIVVDALAELLGE